MTQKPHEGAPETAADAKPDAEQFEAFLRRHPDFLGLRPELLAVLEPPRRWTDDSVVDLQSYLIQQQRAEIARLEDSRQELIDASRAYLSNQARTQAAALALIGAQTVEALSEAITADLPMRLDIDAVTLCFESGRQVDPTPLSVLPVRWLEPGVVGRVLPDGRDVALLDNADDARALFGEGAGLANSAGALRLNALHGKPPGLLALGSRSSDDFRPGRATDHLAFLGMVLDTCLRRTLDVSPHLARA
jgi:uncharacterized protein YigA (DUF484 family)